MRIFLCLLFVFLSSCVTRGRDFSSDTSWIQSQSTTRDDVKARLGAPFSVGKSTHGVSWTYGYYKHSLLGKSRNKELKFTWNDDGTVRMYSFSSSFAEDKRLELVK